MSITTRKGDDGSTGLLYGQRVPKNHPQIEAVGSFDEFNSALGLAKATCPNVERKQEIERIQKELVALMGEVVCAEADAARYAASKFEKINEQALARIDAGIVSHESRNLRLDGWATPGSNLHAASVDSARAIGRRAERHLVGLASHGRHITPISCQYVNRVCDLLWLMARAAEQE